MDFIRVYHRRVAAFAALIYLIAAWFSVGIYHWDEQFQILEFAWYKLGNAQLSTLAWEYEAAIRPGLQPFLAYVLIQLAGLLGMTEPMTVAFFIRAISALVSVVCIRFFVSVFLSDITKDADKKLFIFLSYFFYFMPFMAVRFSSESWSALAFIVALGFLKKYLDERSRISVIVSGIFLGISFQFRYQAGIMIFGLALWLLVFYWKEIFAWIRLFGGFLLACAIGALSDYWLYGSWELPFVSYFDVNLNQNKAAEFGVSPWWWYFKELLQADAIAAVQVVLLALLILFMIKKYNSMFTWVLIPFVAIHCLIGHKEYRFLFPLVLLLPYMLSGAVAYVRPLLKINPVVKVLCFGILFINTMGVVATTLSPAMTCVKGFDYLRTNAPEHCEVHHSEWYFMLLNDSAQIRMNFYYPVKVKGNYYDSSVMDSLDIFPEEKEHQYIITTHPEYVNQQMWEAVYRPLPVWLHRININNWMRIKDGGWVLYKRKNY